MGLLALPAEILQLILHHVTTPSFLQATLSCSTIYNVAKHCREVLLHHLHSIPGIKLGLEDVDTPELFILLRRRAASHLFGANFILDQTFFSPDKGLLGAAAQTAISPSEIDVAASALSSWSSPNVAFVFKGSPTVRLYSVLPDGLLPRETLRPPFGADVAVKALKVAFGPLNTISVIYSCSPRSSPCDPTSSRPQYSEDDAFHRFGMHVVHYSLGRPLDIPCTACFLEYSERLIPTAFAVSSRLRIAVAWRDNRYFHSNRVVLYTAASEPSSTTALGQSVLNYDDGILFSPALPRPTNRPFIPNNPGISESRIASLCFSLHGTQLYYTSAGSLLPQIRQDLTTSSTSASSSPVGRPSRTHPQHSTPFGRMVFVPLHDPSPLLAASSGAIPFFISKPFHGVHDSFYEPLVGVNDPASTANSTRYCSRKLLSIGTSSPYIHSPRPVGFGRAVLCLLRHYSEELYHTCNHLVHLDATPEPSVAAPPNGHGWRVVARLWGFRELTTNLGGIWAASEGGTRVAVADWGRVLVWALAPSVLIDEAGSDVGPEGFYAGQLGPIPGLDEADDAMMVVLKPIVVNLPRGVVVHQIVFPRARSEDNSGRKEDEMLLLTGLGVIQVDLSARARGRRRTLQIPIEWPDLPEPDEIHADTDSDTEKLDIQESKPRNDDQREEESLDPSTKPLEVDVTTTTATTPPPNGTKPPASPRRTRRRFSSPLPKILKPRRRRWTLLAKASPAYPSDSDSDSDSSFFSIRSRSPSPPFASEFSGHEEVIIIERTSRRNSSPSLAASTPLPALIDEDEGGTREQGELYGGDSDDEEGDSRQEDVRFPPLDYIT